MQILPRMAPKEQACLIGPTAQRAGRVGLSERQRSNNDHAQMCWNEHEFARSFGYHSTCSFANGMNGPVRIDTNFVAHRFGWRFLQNWQVIEFSFEQLLLVIH